MSVTPFNTGDSVQSLSPDVKALPPSEIIPDALLLQITSKVGVIEGDQPSVRCPFMDATGAAGFIDEGAAIPESTPTDREVQIFTGKVASFWNVSREQYGQADLSTLLQDAAKRDITQKANTALLSQAAPEGEAVTPPAGILIGITPVSQSIETTQSLDPVIDAVSAVEVDGGKATHILADPLGWAYLSKVKAATDSAVSLLGAGATAADRKLLGLPVLVDKAVPQGTLVVLDRTAVLSAYGSLQLATSTDFAFNQDVVSLRLTWRFGAKVSWPNRIQRVSVFDAS